MELTTRRIVFVTGISGAGKSTAANVLEDLGYETVDNLPVSLLSQLVLSGVGHPVAIGIDVRVRDFDARNILDIVERLRTTPDFEIIILFLECDDAELENRFKTTRRRHPLAHDRRVSDGIAQERNLLTPLKEAANLVIDTTDLNVVEFRRSMDGYFAGDEVEGMTVFVTSFSFARGIPRESDMVFDVRFLRNPHYDPDLENQTGQDGPVGDFISRDEGFEMFVENFKQLLEPLLPRYASEGKRYLTIAIGCTGGRHRSVFLTETLAGWITSMGWATQMRHRDLENSQKQSEIPLPGKRMPPNQGNETP